ncbi:MAG: EamA family transporter [Coriobacteriia bacterium]|nr:EamA family transporter [Coriobacteriia bacterium]
MADKTSGRVSGSRVEGYALVVLAATCWAGGGLIAKWLFTDPGPAASSWLFAPLGIQVDPLVLSAARAFVSVVITLAYLGICRRDLLRVRPQDLPFLAVFGVFGLALVHFAYFKTISVTGVATAILLEYLAPVIVLVFSVALLKERLTLALPVAVALSVSGCALVVGAIGGGGLSVSGEGLVWGLVSAVLFAGYALMGRYASERFAPWTLLAYGLGAGSVFWFVVLGGPSRVIALLSDARAFAAVLVLSVVSTVIPFGAFLKALHYIEATKASVTSSLEPVIAGVAAWLVFGERLSATQMLGGALVIGAVLVSQVRTRTSAEMPVAPSESNFEHSRGV